MPRHTRPVRNRLVRGFPRKGKTRGSTVSLSPGRAPSPASWDAVGAFVSPAPLAPGGLPEVRLTRSPVSP